jgi:hypothetical protein
LGLDIVGSFRGKTSGRFAGYKCIHKPKVLPNRLVHEAFMAMNRVSELHPRSEKGE